MNIGRFRSFIELLLYREQQFDVQNALQNLQTQINNLTSQPQNANFQSGLASGLTLLREKATAFGNSLTPAQHDMLLELEGGEMLGAALSGWATQWIAENAMTPAVARDKINEMTNRRSNLLTTLQETVARLKTLGVAPEEPPAGQAEIGFLIPRNIFENDFGQFRAELKFLAHTINLYSEAVTGSVEPITIGEISASDPVMFLGISAGTVLAISGTIKWLLESLKTSLEIRDLLNKGKSIGLPDSALKPMADTIDERLAKAIEDRVQVVVANMQNEARKNEVANGLRIATRDLLGRIERGMKVELKISHQPTAAAETDEEATDSVAATFAELEAIQQELVFPRLSGDAIIQITQKNETEGDAN